MQQLLQEIRSGELRVREIPAPQVRAGEVLIANAFSAISAGTELSIRQLAQKSLLEKARARPDHVKRVLEKIRQEGFVSTLRQVRDKLDEPMPLGYSSAGTVIACGAGVQEFRPGDRVASNGPHAGIVSVPKLLCARIPEQVSFQHAAFTTLAAIAMQGVRLSRLTLGESALVIGLGIVGQLTVGLLRSAGCRVIATDLDHHRCSVAKQMGAEIAEPHLTAEHVAVLTGNLGVDAVLITASTDSNAPIKLSADAVRKKGRIVLVGVIGLQLDRRPFYFKEAEFVVSCSYGPGRYDPEYEERGHDYPAPYVRWTEQRNMQSVLDMMARGLDMSPLITHQFAIERAGDAYTLIENKSEPHIGILLEYPASTSTPPRVIQRRPLASPKSAFRVGVLGAGNFARLVLLPAICRRKELEPAVLCSAGGVSAENTGNKYGFAAVATDESAVFNNPEIDVVFSLTRHDQHARHIVEAITAKKPIFVEKPLCVSVQELQQMESLLAELEDGHLIMVGFNRRFSPAAQAAKQFFADVAAPVTVSIRFNAGPIPPDHWTQHDQIGGGRLIGEACHAIDLATYLVGSIPVRVYAEAVGGPNCGPIRDDQTFITLRHANGSISSIGYLSGGDKAFPKERVEVFGGGRVAVIDDFRQVITCAAGRTKHHKLARQDKGHAAEIEAFVKSLGTGIPPISWEELRCVTLASILAVQSLRDGIPLPIH